MRILILLVGTVGDTLPFLHLAKVMQTRYGHCVRIATHGDLRRVVEQAGLRFYPLEGTSRQMAEFGAALSMKLGPFVRLVCDLPAAAHKVKTLHRVVMSSYDACVLADPEDAAAEPWHADAILANPTANAHVHCAEALGVPLHLVFPNPWVATREYPHPYSGWRYQMRREETSASGFAWRAKQSNLLSYALLDEFVWVGLLMSVNALRARCGLRSLRLGARGASLIADQRIPFTQMWSPSLSPRPSDWPQEVRLAGFCFGDGCASQGVAVDEASPQIAALLTWLAAGPKPILIGFGSMVFDGTRTATLILAAAARAAADASSVAGDDDEDDDGGSVTRGASRRASAVRVLLQTASAAGDMAAHCATSGALPAYAFHCGRIPHEWLLPRVAAVVHHGGAGTVGASLRLGLPTAVIPFMGDQFFYGAAVAAAGAGPAPVPFPELSEDKLASVFEALLSGKFHDGTCRLAASLDKEDGAAACLEHFHGSLPLADMSCDLSTLLGEPSLGRHYYPRLRLKVSDEVHRTLSDSDAIDQRQLRGARPHVAKVWRLGAAITSPCSGLVAGLFGFLWEVIRALIGVLTLGPRAACANCVAVGPVSGVGGLLLGSLAALVLLVVRPIYACVLLLDRLCTGAANGWLACCWLQGSTQHKHSRFFNHCLDPEMALAALERAPFCGQPRGEGSGTSSTTVRPDDTGGMGRLPLHGPSPPATGARLAQIEAGFVRLLALRRLFDDLTTAAGGSLGRRRDEIRLADVAHLLQLADDGCASGEGTVRPLHASAPPAPPAPPSPPTPVSCGSYARLAAAIETYLQERRQTHLRFGEFVLLCRRASVGV